ncbi:MAG: HAMP domain-containing protein [Tenericutes bacterium]|nr:HAMP domain-containing protein [Mycoplasmatota bacterium]
MKISIFIKTFLTLLFSFVILFLGSQLYLYNNFSNRYVEENISAVKNAIINSAADLENDVSLVDSMLEEASSETQYIRFQNNAVTEMVGPTILTESEILFFVIDIYDNDDLITEGKLSYTITIDEDIYNISYIYRFGGSDYLLVLTKIQSLNNIDVVLKEITINQGIFLIVTIIILSLIISRSFTKPIKKINKYAKSLARLDFDQKLRITRKDELQELTSSLNEMAFNLQKTYSELNQANAKLKGDIEFEQLQEKKKKELIMTINHELKTPVSVIKGMVEGMIDGVGRFSNKDVYLKQVLKQLEKLSDMTKDLTYSLKLEDIAKANDSANLISLENSLDSVKELAKISKVNLSLDIKKYKVQINEELLAILVTNILKNAISYTEDFKVYLKTYKQADTVFIEVKNKGEIKESDLEKIFEPYYRVNLNKEGTGLGLFIVKQIAEIYQAEYKIFNDNGYVISKIGLKKL